MSRTGTPDSSRHQRRTELTLYRHCRRGRPDALRALLYRSGDYWYSVALMVCGDESAAAEAVAETWQRLLAKLGSWHFGGRLQRRAETILLRVLASHASYGQVKEALQRSK